MKAYVSLDNQSYDKKPVKTEISKIKYRAVSQWKLVEVDKLADLVGNHGYAMVPAHLEGGIASRNFTGIQLFALDFDHGSRFEDIKRKCEELGIPVSFAYHTFGSSPEEERFRVVFVYECLIEDAFVAEVISYMLMKIFPECDGQCRNLDRMFFGGKGLICVDPEACITLVQLLLPFLYAMDTNGNYKRNIQSFSKRTGVLLFNNLPMMGKISDLNLFFDEKVDPAVIHITGDAANSSFFIAKRDGMHPSITCKEKIRRIKINDGKGSCRLLDEFLRGEALPHEARFAILTNLLHIFGGLNLFMNIIKAFYGEKEYDKWSRDVKYMKGYHSCRCSGSFCPYYDSCENAGTIVNTLALDRKVYKTEEERYYTLEEAQECLADNLRNAFESYDVGLHLIKAQTSLGKTTAYIRLIKENPKVKFLIALPTNILKEQVTKDLYYAGLLKEEIFMTASIQGNCFIPYDIRQEIANAHKRGIHNQTKKILSAHCKETVDDFQVALKEEYRKLLDGVKAIKDERVVVTTHAFFLQMPEEFLKQYTIIIDEDILQLQIFNRIYSISAACLEELVRKRIPIFCDVAKEILQTELNLYRNINVPRRYPMGEEKLEKLECFGEDDNINDLLYAKVFVRLKNRYTGNEEIKYFCPQKLPPLKYIVLSATLNEKIYQAYFAGDMRVYMYPEKKAAYKGKVVQYTYHSLGRNDLSDKRQVFFIAKELAENPGLEIITFKESRVLPELSDMNSKGLHFGNTTGINSLSGCDLGIVGTPYKVEEAYKLIACYLGADVNQKKDSRPGWRRVVYKNTSFMLTAYRDPILQEIQLYSLESELEQCVGRARLLRKNCTVYVFSAFPCEQAKIITGDYLQEK